MTSNNHRSTPFLAAFVVAALMISAPADATIARAVSFDEKVVRADSIILGRCVRTESQFDPTGKWIVTYSTFAVDRNLKGAQLPEVTLVTPGGQVGSLRQETVGVPRFRQGDRHVLFVKKTSLGSSVLFFDQGTYKANKAADGEVIVEPVSSDTVLLDTQSGRAGVAEGPRTLRDFETQVREILSEPGKRDFEKAAVVASSKAASRNEPGAFTRFVSTNRLLLSLVTIGLVLSALPWILRSR